MASVGRRKGSLADLQCTSSFLPPLSGAENVLGFCCGVSSDTSGGPTSYITDLKSENPLIFSSFSFELGSYFVEFRLCWDRR
jgi:hypothetical protein